MLSPSLSRPSSTTPSRVTPHSHAQRKSTPYSLDTPNTARPPPASIQGTADGLENLYSLSMMMSLGTSPGARCSRCSLFLTLSLDGLQCMNVHRDSPLPRSHGHAHCRWFLSLFPFLFLTLFSHRTNRKFSQVLRAPTSPPPRDRESLKGKREIKIVSRERLRVSSERRRHREDGNAHFRVFRCRDGDKERL